MKKDLLLQKIDNYKKLTSVNIGRFTNTATQRIEQKQLNLQGEQFSKNTI